MEHFVSLDTRVLLLLSFQMTLSTPRVVLIAQKSTGGDAGTHRVVLLARKSTGGDAACHHHISISCSNKIHD